MIFAAPGTIAARQPDEEAGSMCYRLLDQNSPRGAAIRGVSNTEYATEFHRVEL